MTHTTTARAVEAVTVRQFASRSRCDLPGYFQWFEAFDKDGEFIGAVYEPEHTGGQYGERHLVIERQVKSASGTSWGAIEKFREWQRSGKPETFLMEE